MIFKEKYGSWAIVAGAAEGLGASFTRALAAKGLNILLVDINNESIGLLAERIQREFKVSALCLNLDLGATDAAERIMDAIGPLDCRLLVYNAAYSRVAPFLSQPVASMDQYVDVNCRTMIKLVHRFSDHLIQQKKTGGILIMSSLAGLIGSRLVAPYSATKAFAALLAESLSHEFSPFHIDVLACMAGATATPAFLRSGPKLGILGPGVEDPDFVVSKALSHLGRRVVYIPGIANRMSYCFLSRILPRATASNLVNKAIGRMYQKKL